MKSHLFLFLFVSFYRLLTRGGKVLIEETACPRNELPPLATQGARKKGGKWKGKEQRTSRQKCCMSFIASLCLSSVIPVSFLFLFIAVI